MKTALYYGAITGALLLAMLIVAVTVNATDVPEYVPLVWAGIVWAVLTLATKLRRRRKAR